MFRVRRIERDLDDDDLVRRAAQGRRPAQRSLFQKLSAPVHEALHDVLGSNDHIEGVLEDTFVEIFRSLAAYDGKLDLNTWACAIAMRVVSRHLQSGQRDFRGMAERWSRVACVGLSEEDAPRAELEQVLGLLQGLEPELHVTFALFISRRSIEDISALTDVNVVAVRERIALVRRHLFAAACTDGALMASIACHTPRG
jgi:DNA-directed RNA polymerase specialized sigma24 family protein